MFVERFTRMHVFLLASTLIAAVSFMQLQVQDIMLMMMAVRDAAGAQLVGIWNMFTHMVKD